jgi:hypothetical protein
MGEVVEPLACARRDFDGQNAMRSVWQIKQFLGSLPFYPARTLCLAFNKPVLLVGSVPAISACVDPEHESLPGCVEKAIRLVEEYAPECHAEIPVLFRWIMLNDRVVPSRFEAAGRCWLVNPWKAEEVFKDMDLAAAFLGGLLVFDASVAKSLKSGSGVANVGGSRLAATRAALEFFYSCRSRFDGEDLDAIISVFSGLEAGKGWGDE